MAHFQLDAELQDVMKLDSVPARGPIPRWQRKTADQGIHRKGTKKWLEYTTQRQGYQLVRWRPRRLTVMHKI